MHRHRASTDFWVAYGGLPYRIRERADKQFALLASDPQHPSLVFKKVGVRRGYPIWSARVTLSYRALALELSDGFLWYWIGDHTSYESRLA